MDQKSILDFAMGAIKERADYEVANILKNIADPNTNPTKKRTLTLTVAFSPDSERQTIGVDVVAKSKLEPTNPVKTSLYLTEDDDGKMAAFEMVPQIPGQIDMNEQEQNEPVRLKLVP